MIRQSSIIGNICITVLPSRGGTGPVKTGNSTLEILKKYLHRSKNVYEYCYKVDEISTGTGPAQTGMSPVESF
jgi:hypothetical protein